MQRKLKNGEPDGVEIAQAMLVDSQTGEVLEEASPIPESPVQKADLPLCTLPAVVEPQVLVASPKQALESIKDQIDCFLEARRYLLDKILPLMVPGIDFYDIKGKKSLGKPGAEKMAAIYRFTASFEVDKDTMACLPERQEWVSYICTLRRDGVMLGEGRGAETLSEAKGDPNKMVKMAQKSAFVDAVIRTTGSSDLWTQDIEDMPEFRGASGTSPVEDHGPRRSHTPAPSPSKPYYGTGKEKAQAKEEADVRMHAVADLANVLNEMTMMAEVAERKSIHPVAIIEGKQQDIAGFLRNRIDAASKWADTPGIKVETYEKVTAKLREYQKDIRKQCQDLDDDLPF